MLQCKGLNVAEKCALWKRYDGLLSGRQAQMSTFLYGCAPPGGLGVGWISMVAPSAAEVGGLQFLPTNSPGNNESTPGWSTVTSTQTLFWCTHRLPLPRLGPPFLLPSPALVDAN